MTDTWTEMGEEVSANLSDISLSVCNFEDVHACTSTENCELLMMQLDKYLTVVESIKPKTIELMELIHKIDRKSLKVMYRKNDILLSQLAKAMFCNKKKNHGNSDSSSESDCSSSVKLNHTKIRKKFSTPPRNETAPKKVKTSDEFSLICENKFNLLNDIEDIHDTVNSQPMQVAESNESNLSEFQVNLFEDPPLNENEITLKHFQQNKPTNSDPKVSVEQKSLYVPPIIIDDPKNGTELLKTLTTLTQEVITGRMVNGKLKIYPPTSNAHRAITKKIEQDGIKAHTYELNDEKKIKVVIRGLPSDHNTMEIMKELRDVGFEPELCHPLRNRQTNTNRDLFLVVLPKKPKSKEVYHLQNMGYYRISVESLKKKQSPAMCYRCQDYFHHSSRCTRTPRCLKCAGNHWSRDCPKPPDTPATCLHCSGNHTANYSGCPKNPLNRRSFPAPPPNAWSDPLAIAKVKEVPQQNPTPPPATQSVPRAVQRNQNQPQSQEAFFNHMSNLMSTMMTTFFSQMAKFQQCNQSTNVQ